MPSKLLPLMSAWLFCLFLPASANADPAEAAVMAWLEAIDNGEFERAWEKASPLLQTPLSPSMLERTVSLARQNAGSVESRRRLRVVNDTSMPGAPNGDYKIFTYSTRFDDQRQLTETITPHLENGEWRVSGYYLE